MHAEKVVQQALDVIMQGRTSVVVAHRLSTIRNAHKIALVHRGAILEQVGAAWGGGVYLSYMYT